MPNDDWARIEDAFRLWAFRVYYEKSFADENDPAVRFVKALLASCQPIQDRQAVVQWHRNRLKHRTVSLSPGCRGVSA